MIDLTDCTNQPDNRTLDRDNHADPSKESSKKPTKPKTDEKYRSNPEPESLPTYSKTCVTKIETFANENVELRKMLINRCESIVYDTIKQIIAGRFPAVSYEIPTVDTLADLIEIDDLESSSSIVERSSINRNVVDFGRSSSKIKFGLITTIIAVVHNLLLNDTTETRRSLFYELKSRKTTSNLINSQKQIDEIVTSVANLLQCSPWETGLIATAKGLAAGNLTLTIGNNEKIDYDVPGGALIPQIVSNLTAVETRADLVIVVEKDAIFQKLLQEKCPSALNCILMTGKGYPDVPTRMLVKILGEKIGLPIYILVDADPYGMEIMFNYKYGSIKLCRDRESLACPSARWIGVFPSELEILEIPKLDLTERDVDRLNGLYCRPYIDETFVRELEIMRNGKAEIEALTGITSMYLPTKINNDDYV